MGTKTAYIVLAGLFSVCACGCGQKHSESAFASLEEVLTSWGYRDYTIIQEPSLPGPYRVPVGMLPIVGHTGGPLSGALWKDGTRVKFQSPAVPGYFQEAVPLETPAPDSLTFVILKKEVRGPQDSAQ